MRRKLALVAVAIVMGVAGCGGDDEEARDRSRGGAYDACDIEADECPLDVDGCAGVIVDYVDYRTAERGVCTSVCESDAECPADPGGLGGACIDFGGTALCYERCDADEDCAPDWGCTDRLPAPGGGEMFFEPVCLPVR
ncbi:hypothetical protein [Sandaracinus amylolyticus]|uniref:hypothetical protein n=1 Tax=Sandaracinus amylolyticus TaxID=927083 RepID=UPI0012EDA3AE|nr:hypothetical protein [Sandaracinus amylolyticus]